MKIAALVSGGVDSAVVVDRLIKEGHELHLFYIRIGMDNGEGDCSAEEDIEICQLLSRKYNLPFDIISLHEEYWEYVMAYTLDTVKKGLTPHPDMMCNKIIKFGFFEERRGKEFDATATGHYASVKEYGGRLFLATAADPVKDQTDFLAQISYDQLSHLMFPLGEIPKDDVRRLAREASLPNATRKDSQGICFLGKINYNDFIRRHLGERKGPVIEIETGKKIGTHNGFWFYTIGQRKGLGLSGGPWFVVKKNVRDNVIYVSRGYTTPKQYGRLLPIEEMNWISYNPFERETLNDELLLLAPLSEDEGGEYIKITFKNRHTPEFIEGKMRRNDSGYIVESLRDVQGIAPGQFVIIYSADHRFCLGSGMITLPQKSKKDGKQ